jgi:hypothetical protein
VSQAETAEPMEITVQVENRRAEPREVNVTVFPV